MVPHQANVRIIQAACARLGIPEERTAVVIDRYGNTSSASIPLALYDAIGQGRVHDGDNHLLTGFGGGMTWARAVFRWNACATGGGGRASRSSSWPQAGPSATEA
jgi:3-oxoacyl-[acyl-carrier-protein] synthase-3